MGDRLGDEDVIWPRFAEVDLAAGALPYSVLRQPVIPWGRPLPALALDPYGNRADFLLTPGVQRLTHGEVLSSYDDALLTWSHCVLAGEDFQCFFCSQSEAWARNLASHPVDHVWRREAGLLLSGGRVGLLRAKWTPQVHVPGRTLLATADEPFNWGLFVLNALPAAAHFLANRDRYDRFMCYAPPGNHLDLLKLVGIDEADFIQHDVFKTYRLDQVHTIRHTMRDLFVHAPARAMLRGLAERVAAGAPPGPARIFLSRHRRFLTQGPTYRDLLNETELITGLETRGFVTLNLEFMSPEDQIRALASAEIVVGLGGAAMFNTVFCAPGTMIVDIESTPLFIDAHSNIFASCGHRYAIILGQEDATDPRADHRRWRIDVAAVLAAIDEVSKHVLF